MESLILEITASREKTVLHLYLLQIDDVQYTYLVIKYDTWENFHTVIFYNKILGISEYY